ncbi:MAG: hydantoinase B/oxoprolinase family protein [Candidatus Odinarchaeota archaeon]|nr:hydantoinase B/oxoprolinase family protein [Candidatus Odinarchaeota archaeon]
MVNVITVEVIRGALEYTTEEMGIILRNSAYSANIKERMDHSCAIFDSQGRMLAQAEHIPVHLGAMPIAVEQVMKDFEEMYPGDMFVLNDPFRGGTHLPDLTLIAPIFYNEKLVGFVVNRAHHSDIGGKTPGSMPGDAEEIFEEGLVIPPVKLMDKGIINKDVLEIILKNTRTPEIRKGDLMAQIAANNIGRKQVLKLIEKYGLTTFQECMEAILDYSERRMIKEIQKFPKVKVDAEDYLDDSGVDDNPIKIRVSVIIRKNELIFDFTGTDKQVRGPVNAPYSVTLSASYYVLRAVTDPTIPANHGAYRPLTVKTEKGTVVDAIPPCAVSGGNVETSQRIVDVLLKAFSQIIPDRIPAACQGTMNNILIGGINPRNNKPFTFYETIGGGYGARPGLDGIDGIHSHMTNTMNTPIEEIEKRFPLLILKYELRKDSGGLGKWRGGLGIERVYKLLTAAKLSVLGERHKFRPWGLKGGLLGASGEYFVIKNNGEKITLRSKETIWLQQGDIIVIRTPGGGGYGNPIEREYKLVIEDLENEKISKEIARRYFRMNFKNSTKAK